MSVTWSPDPSTSPFLSAEASEVIPETTITATVDTAASDGDSEDSGETETVTIVGYSCVCEDQPDDLIIAVSDSGITISSPNTLTDSFPIQDIEYQIKGEEFHCYTWGDLPDEADEVIRYIPYSDSTQTWTLTCTVSLSDGTAESADFVLEATMDYTPGRDALVEAVDARR